MRPISYPTSNKSSKLSWIVSITASLFFFYEFIQINMFNSIDQDVLKAFHLNATQLGLLSACYFYSTVGFLLPAGQILDRFKAKKVILITLFICIIGITGFALSNTMITACFFRLLEGIGSAFCFLGSFRIASKWFSPNKLSFVTGIIVTIGMLGGVVAQTPLAYLVEFVGWRHALLIDATLGLFIFYLIYTFVKDSPDKFNNGNRLSIQYWNTLRLIYLTPHNWLCGVYTCLLNLPLALLGALWGSLYLEQVQGFSRAQASEILMMIFIGTIVGSPIVGYIADYIGQKKLPMILGALSTILIILLIIYSKHLPYWDYIFLFFLLGLFSSSQILGYPAAVERNSVDLAGMSASVVSFTTMSGYIIFQPLFGWIMDLKGKPNIVNGEVFYAPENYYYGLLIIPVTLMIATFIAMMIKKNNKIADSI